MDPAQVVTTVSQALGESGDTVDAAFRALFRVFPDAGPADWSGAEQALSAQPPVEYDKLAGFLEALKGLAAEAGRPEDPRIVIDDYELRGHFAAGAQAPAADQAGQAGQAAQPTGTPVAEGSQISRAGDAFYLQDGRQVWQAGSGDSVYYHDGTQNYDTLGRPLVAPGAVPQAAAPAAGQGSEDPAAWNGYLAQNGPRWDGTEASWQQFRDWFVYTAGLNQVGSSAQGFIALAESGDKRAVFAQYGVTLPGGDATAATAAAPSGTATGGAPDLMDRLRLEVMEPALAHALNAQPELAALGEDRLRELLAEVTADHLDRRTG